ncbi:MAG: serine hydrolase [Candidatus Competibacteraceae bacterium]|nr:serine hydrolase [Candidatus Competibacteraceae bacterium]
MKQIFFLGYIIAIYLVMFSCTRADSRIDKRPTAPVGPLEQALRDKDTLPPFLKKENKWVDSVMNTLTIDQKIGQLFMVAAYSKTASPSSKINDLISGQQIGGLIFMQGGPGRQVQLINHYQKLSSIPLMIGIDGEWGLSMRLDSTQKFPWQMTLGAIQNDELIYDMGKEIARQCRRVGVHVNFAPVVDINNNRNNPVIGARSFGEIREQVARKGIAYMKGMQDQGVLANAKHFPGHGDTDKDSHLALPSILHNRARLDSIELYPFRELIRNGLGSMMIAHLSIPALDNAPNTPTTLSKKVVTDLLQHDMGFKGLIFTDALNMKGVADFYEPGIADLKALLAGNDVLLFSGDVPKAISEIKKAIQTREITEDYINEKCRKILKAKYWLGLHTFKPISTERLQEDLHTRESEVVMRRLVEASLTLIKNQSSLIPLKQLDTLRIAAISIGEEKGNPFHKRLKDYAEIDVFSASESAGSNDAQALLEKLKTYNIVILSVHKSNDSPFKSYRISAENKSFIQAIARKKETILTVFANAYSLSGMKEMQMCKGVLLAYQNSELAQDYAAQLIMGGISAKGRLPVSITDEYKAGHGIETGKPIRLKYTIPEDVGMKGSKLDEIDKIVFKAIRDSVFPGCQILAARSGQVFFRKSYGFHTYENREPVTDDDIYDIASITKVGGTLPVLMQLVDKKLIDLSKTLGLYLPELSGTDKNQVTLIDILTHQAGFKSWLPFHQYTMDANKQYKQGVYDTTFSSHYPYQVADNLYASFRIRDTIFKANISTPLSGKKKYLYSDLGYYFLHRIIEEKTKQPLDKYLMENLYKPLGAVTLGYKPLERFSRSRIIPTEDDKQYRKQLVHGYVHDQGAALMGGVAGHAGLFSNANDLAKLMQLYLNKGEYGGQRYILSSTIEEFIRCQFCANGNRRGIGFDKPTPNGTGGTACDCVSYASFGHAGFTGTLAWVDPEKDLVYIFLSNRVYPDAENRKLIKEGQRALVQQVFYNAL